MWQAVQSVIVLLAILCSIVAPPSLCLAAADGGHEMIGTLDVCHSTSPALSARGSQPCVHESICYVPSPTLETFYEIVVSAVTPISISFPDERPPKI